jgi:hypothetical protein
MTRVLYREPENKSVPFICIYLPLVIVRQPVQPKSVDSLKFKRISLVYAQ